MKRFSVNWADGWPKSGWIAISRRHNWRRRPGVSKRTVERLEAGAVATQLSGFIRVCRVLDVIERFDLLIPEPVPSPVAQLKLGGKKRQRASTVKPAKPSAKKWQWGR